MYTFQYSSITLTMHLAGFAGKYQSSWPPKKNDGWTSSSSSYFSLFNGQQGWYILYDHQGFSRNCGKIWVWVNTYRYIFSGVNIHLPAILGFTRYQGFDPSPYPRIVLFTIQIIQLISNFLVTSPRFLVASGDLAEWHDFPDLYKGDWERHGKNTWKNTKSDNPHEL